MDSAKKLTFYHYPYSNGSRSVLLVLRNLQLDFKVVIINCTRDEHLSESFRKINPKCCIPTLLDKFYIQSGSLTIAKYLVNTLNSKKLLYPENINEWSMVEELLCFNDEVLSPLIRDICLPAALKNKYKIPLTMISKLNSCFEYLNRKLAKNTKYFINKLTIADLFILSTISTIIYAGANIKPFRHLSVWYENCKQIPGCDENDAGAMVYSQLIKSRNNDLFECLLRNQYDLN